MIHPTAVIHPAAKIGEGVSIGPYSVIGEFVSIGDNTRIASHVVIEGHTTIGQDNRIFQFASLGGPPQDKKYQGEPTRLVIGDRNTIREYGTLNIGTAQDEGITSLGDDNWIMAYVHIAHDCRIGNKTIFANNAQLAGHVHVGDWVIFGGFTGVHQFCHIGAHAMTAAGSVVFQDVPPYVMAAGNTATPFGTNAEGLKRRGFSSEALLAIKRAYRTLYRSGFSLDEAKAKIEAETKTHPELQLFLDFFTVAKRGIIR